MFFHLICEITVLHCSRHYSTNNEISIVALNRRASVYYESPRPPSKGVCLFSVNTHFGFCSRSIFVMSYFGCSALWEFYSHPHITFFIYIMPSAASIGSHTLHLSLHLFLVDRELSIIDGGLLIDYYLLMALVRKTLLWFYSIAKWKKEAKKPIEAVKERVGVL